MVETVELEKDVVGYSIGTRASFEMMGFFSIFSFLFLIHAY